MDKEQILRNLLLLHEFPTAAKELKIRDMRTAHHIDYAIDQWRNYPQCLDKYPKQLKPKSYPGI